MQRPFLQIYAVFLFAFTSAAGVKTSDVTFYLFTKNADNFVQIDSSNASAHVDHKARVVVLIHGWTENRTTQWYHNLTEAFFTRGDNTYNIIQVDYYPVSKEIYPVAAARSPDVGDLVGKFVADLVAGGIALENIEICGHSLGGQVAGFAGKYFRNKTSKLLPRITALDPAGPLFFASGTQRLQKTDAEIVYVIHTDRGKLGYLYRCGTVDVFPNDGFAVQPGCPNLAENDIVYCSHHMSYRFYIYAVAHPKSLFGVHAKNYATFLEGQCGNGTIDLGAEITVKDRGSYYLTTKNSEPYRLKP